MRKTAIVLVAGLLAWSSAARPVCIGETCYLSEEAAREAGVSEEQIAAALAEGAHGEAQGPDSAVLKELIQDVEQPVAASAVEVLLRPRVGFGYKDAPQFLEFLAKGNEAANATESAKSESADAKESAESESADAKESANVLANASVAMAFLLVLLGGLAMNLTPCVLPLVPVSLVLVGRGWARGAAYGLGMALSYGVLGLAAAFGGLMFGTIQSSPWFNIAVAVVFLVLGLAASGVFFIDFSKFRPRPKAGGAPAAQKGGLVGPFLLGAGTAVLAGACVAPFLIATLVQTATWFGEGRTWAVVLPFVLGAGMGLPWPFAAAGMKVLPKPGAWMPWVNRVFAVLMFGMALWYGWGAWTSWQARSSAPNSPAATSEGRLEMTPEGRFEVTPATWKQAFADARATGKPVFVDVWATWCKNCLAMEKSTFKNADVQKALERYAVIRLQAENPNELKGLPEFKGLNIMGLPAFVVFDRAN